MSTPDELHGEVPAAIMRQADGDCQFCFTANEVGQVRMGSGFWLPIEECRAAMIQKWGAERVTPIENGRFTVRILTSQTND